MTTSGSYDHESTMAEIINDAFALINAHDPSETLSADKWTIGKRKLNQLMKFASIRRGMWLLTEVTHTLTAGTASYAIGDGETIDTPKPREIVSAWHTVSGMDYPIEVISRDDYERIPTKTTQGPPVSVYYHRDRENGTLYVWPTGTATEKYLTLKTHRPIQDFDAEGNNPDLPEEWVLLITYMLAELLAPQYLGGVVPAAVMDKKNELMASLINDDEERTSIIFAV